MQLNQHGASSMQSFLTVWYQHELLEDALNDLDEWLRDQDRCGIGRVYLSFAPTSRKWLVLVTQDLIDRVIPF
jgi:hypothetical protein